MREIKFRAYWKDKMHQVTLLGLQYEHDPNPPVYIGSEDVGVPHYSDLALMQYTGLRDKNGVEVYEGDICRTDDVVYAVEWLSIGWSLNLLNSRKVEVIGNIYENPELLEATS